MAEEWNPMEVSTITAPPHLQAKATTTSTRDAMWRDLYEKREALICALEEALALPPRDFTEGDRREWKEIEQAIDYSPQKWADTQQSN